MNSVATEQARVESAYRIAEKVLASLEESIAELRSWTFDEDELAVLDSEGRKALDAFLKRFENVVEAGRRLFRAALVQGREDQRGMSAGEVAIRVEQLGLIDSSDAWAVVISARNAAAHEYSAELDEAAEALARAYQAAVDAVDIVRALLARLRRRFPPKSQADT